MSTITLTFKVPEELEDARQAVQWINMKSVIEDMCAKFRRLEKIDNPYMSADEAVEGIKQTFYEVLEDNDIKIS